jgi:hypothetical protein
VKKELNLRYIRRKNFLKISKVLTLNPCVVFIRKFNLNRVDFIKHLKGKVCSEIGLLFF